MKTRAGAFVPLFFIVLSLFAQNPKKNIAVVELENQGGLASGEMGTLTDRLRAALVRTNAFVVVDRGRMENILEEQGFQMTGCTSAECAVEAGKILGVEQMVTGSIGKLGKVYTIEIVLIDVESSQILKSLSRDRSGEIEGLLQEMQIIAGELARVKEKKPEFAFGSLKITAMPEGSEIIIDGKSFGVTPLTIPNLLSGIHSLVLRKKGYMDDTTRVEIIANKTTNIEAGLKQALVLSIASKPDSAILFINGRARGKTPFRGYFAAGSQLKLKLLKENYKSWQKTVLLDRHRSFRAELEYTEEYARQLAKTAAKTLPDEVKKSSKTWLWVGAGVVAVSTAAYFLLRKKTDEGKPFPSPPSMP